MRQQSKESLIILFVIGALVLNYPFLYLFDHAWSPFGIPLLYLYIYLAWFVMIVLLIAIVERSAVDGPEREPLEHPTDPSSAGGDRGNPDNTDRRNPS
ncbi:MAG: hypothetical protein IPK63_07425 [Candidatus Competibacteraceae bacterium]|nr:hypothetical protein [Candidatus Competibacteraceae bacterium]